MSVIHASFIPLIKSVIDAGELNRQEVRELRPSFAPAYRYARWPSKRWQRSPFTPITVYLRADGSGDEDEVIARCCGHYFRVSGWLISSIAIELGFELEAVTQEAS